MDLLTGKAKEDFEKWIEKEMFHFGFNLDQQRNSINDLSDLFLNALIIEWLDSVGINIILTCEFDYGYEILDKRYEVMEELKKWYDTRHEATTHAIKKANEIYNNQ